MKILVLSRGGAILGAALLCACSGAGDLELAIAPRQRDQAIAAGLAELSAELGRFRITPREHALTGQALLELLQNGAADLALVENSAPYVEGVSTVLPLFRALLHILYLKDLDVNPDDPASLFQGRTVFTPGVGSMAHELLLKLGQHLAIDWNRTVFITDAETRADVIVILNAPSPELMLEYRDSYRLYSLGDPTRAGRGSVADGVTFRYPQMQAVIVPESAYGDVTPVPAVTLGVDMLLVARDDLADELVYDIIQLVIENKQQLAQGFPAVFRGVRDNFDPAALNFPLHPGARSYLERDAPSWMERYAEVWAFVLSLLITLVSALVALQRWRVHRRKDRIDVYYEKVLALRSEACAADSMARSRAIASLNGLEHAAFRQLMDERLAADESFRIFLTLLQETRHELSRDLTGEAVSLLPAGTEDSPVPRRRFRDALSALGDRLG